MRVQRFIVPGPTPSLNEIIAAAKVRYGGRGGGAYSKMKRTWTERIAGIIKKKRIKQIPGQFSIKITVHEKNRRRDPDNISAGAFKFILDALVMTGTIVDDSQKYVKSLEFVLGVPNKNNPNIVVELMEE